MRKCRLKHEIQEKNTIKFHLYTAVYRNVFFCGRKDYSLVFVRVGV